MLGRDTVRSDAVLLTDDEVGVRTENKPRSVMANGDSLYTSLNQDWLEQLNICEPQAETLHSLSLARAPVIVQNPAIIVQPAHLITQPED